MYIFYIKHLWPWVELLSLDRYMLGLSLHASVDTVSKLLPGARYRAKPKVQLRPHRPGNAHLDHESPASIRISSEPRLQISSSRTRASDVLPFPLRNPHDNFKS